MTDDRYVAQKCPRALWRTNGAVWLALLVLLFLSLLVAYLPIGPIKTVAGPLIATMKTMLVVTFFMELVRDKSLPRLASAAGLVFVSTLFALTLIDVLARLLKGW